MRRRFVFWSLIVGCAVLGAAGAAILAQQRSDVATISRQYLIALMVNPPRTQDNPRYFNQTVIETIDTAELAADLTDVGYGVKTIQLAALAESYHIQATVGLAADLTDAQTRQLGEEITTQIGRQSSALAGDLLQSTPAPTVSALLTRSLPQTNIVIQDPAVTGAFGALAGALIGLFIALSLPASRPS